MAQQHGPASHTVRCITVATRGAPLVAVSCYQAWPLGQGIALSLIHPVSRAWPVSTHADNTGNARDGRPAFTVRTRQCFAVAYPINAFHRQCTPNRKPTPPRACRTSSLPHATHAPQPGKRPVPATSYLRTYVGHTGPTVQRSPLNRCMPPPPASNSIVLPPTSDLHARRQPAQQRCNHSALKKHNTSSTMHP